MIGTDNNTLEDYETGTPNVLGTLEMFSELIRTGQAWTLEGTYGRAATALIEGGYIMPTGEIAEKGYEVAGVREPTQEEDQRLLTDSSDEPTPGPFAVPNVNAAA